MATWRDDIIKALKESGGVAPLSDIYHRVKSYRGTVPASYQSIIRGTIELASSDSKVWDKKNNLFYSVDGIGGGVWGLRALQRETPVAVDVADPDLSGGAVTPGKSLAQTYRVIRDTKLCREIKKLHNHECQLCGHTINLPSGGRYAEAHHIIPLGGKHKGADKAENIIVVCPNHHAMLDYGVIKLELPMITLRDKHQISARSITYHNEQVYGKTDQVPKTLEDVLV